MSQQHIVLSDRRENIVCLSHSNQSPILSSQRATARSFQSPLFLRLGRVLGAPLPRACLRLFDTPASLLITSLAELSGSAATCLSNFPQPSRSPFLLGIAVERRKAVRRPSRLLFSEHRLALGGPELAEGPTPIFLPTPPPDSKGFRVESSVFIPTCFPS